MEQSMTAAAEKSDAGSSLTAGAAGGNVWMNRVS
jgi:hypothetical protein